MGFSRQEYWSGLPFPSPVDHILSDLSTMTRRSRVAPCAWLSFIELDKAVVLVWLDWLVSFEYGFSVSALWCCLATPTVLLGFLLPWVWCISSRLLHQSAAAAPYLGRGVSLHRHPSWPSTWDSSSRPSCAHAATAPWTWGCSFQLPPLASGVGYMSKNKLFLNLLLLSLHSNSLLRTPKKSSFCIFQWTELQLNSYFSFNFPA